MQTIAIYRKHVSTWLRLFDCLVFHLFGGALVSSPSSLSFWTGPIVGFSLPSFLFVLK